MKVGNNGARRIGTIGAENLLRCPDVSDIIVSDAVPADSGYVAVGCGGKTTVGAEAYTKSTREIRTVTLEEVA